MIVSVFPPTKLIVSIPEIIPVVVVAATVVRVIAPAAENVNTSPTPSPPLNVDPRAIATVSTVIVSLPVPPSTEAAAVETVIESLPAPPNNVSAPPAAAVIVSLPSPPSIESLPIPPAIVSFPVPPVMVSLPAPPVRASEPAPPTIDTAEVAVTMLAAEIVKAEATAEPTESTPKLAAPFTVNVVLAATLLTLRVTVEAANAFGKTRLSKPVILARSVFAME